MFPEHEPIPQSVQIQQELTSMHIEDWRENDVFHLKWWVLIGLLILCATIWCLLLDKKRIKPACLFAAVCAVTSMGLFEYGDELVLWDYPVDVIPFFPPLTSLNLLMRPFVFSILYQRFPGWKRFMVASLLAAAALCFVMEPLLALAGLYQLVNWNYFFSFAAYVALAMLARFIVEKVLSISQRYGPQPEWQP